MLAVCHHFPKQPATVPLEIPRGPNWTGAEKSLLRQNTGRILVRGFVLDGKELDEAARQQQPTAHKNTLAHYHQHQLIKKEKQQVEQHRLKEAKKEKIDRLRALALARVCAPGQSCEEAKKVNEK